MNCISFEFRTLGYGYKRNEPLDIQCDNRNFSQMECSAEMRQLAPARVVVAKFGMGKLNGAKVVAEIAGVHVTRVYRWMRPKDVGGTGGLIPSRYHSCLLNGARDRGVTLTAEELICTASAVKAQ